MPSESITNRICQLCNKPFYARPSDLRKGWGKYCSRSCQAKNRTGPASGKWKGGPVSCTCKECGAVFTKVIAAVKIGEGKFCSRACHATWRSKNIHGENHPMWRGGRSINAGGYVRFNSADGKHQLEHRVFMERYLGRSLLPNEHVHHINGNKTDNRLENLQLLDASQHSRLHIPDSLKQITPDMLPRGEESPRSKLTEKQVREIRAKHAEQGLTFQSLGREYGVTGTCIKSIVTRRTWAHVD